MSIEVTLDYYTDPLRLGKYSGICYGREGNDEHRLRHVVTVGHLSVLRFGHATFKISSISRVCLAQLTRSKHLDYLVRSSRYCDESSCELVVPERIDRLPEDLKSEWYEISGRAQQMYSKALASGMRKEDARFILPQSQSTELWVTGNYQAWVDFIKLRHTKSAQGEVREVAGLIRSELQKVAPVLFGEPDETTPP